MTAIASSAPGGGRAAIYAYQDIRYGTLTEVRCIRVDIVDGALLFGDFDTGVMVVVKGVARGFWSDLEFLRWV